MILLHFQPVATFPGLLFNDSAAVSTSSDFPRISYENNSAAVSTGSNFPRFYYHDDFTTILYGSNIPKNYFETFGMILTYDLMTLYDYILRFCPKFIDVISYGPKSFQIHGILL